MQLPKMDDLRKIDPRKIDLRTIDLRGTAEQLRWRASATASEVGARVTRRPSSLFRSTMIDEALGDYVLERWIEEPEAAASLRAATASLRDADMQIGPDQGRLMFWLLRTLGARRTIEVGVFTGYSTLMTALALPDDGQVIACDVSESWTSVGRPYWEQAGVADKIDLRLAPATETLAALEADGQADSFDFAFIDADKSGYDAYYEACLRLVKPGGIIAIDNVLWGGSVVRPADQSADTVALRDLNAKIAADDRVERCLLSMGDGVTLARRLV